MVFTLVFLLGVSSIGNPVNTKTDYWESFQTQLQSHEWNLFLKALIQVESGGNSKAIGNIMMVGFCRLHQYMYKK